MRVKDTGTQRAASDSANAGLNPAPYTHVNLAKPKSRGVSECRNPFSYSLLGETTILLRSLLNLTTVTWSFDRTPQVYVSS